MMRNTAADAEPAAARKTVAAALVRSAAVESSLYRALADNPAMELRARHVEDLDRADFQALRGDLIILDIDPNSRQEFALLTEFVAERRGVPLVVTSPWLDVTSMCQLMRIGVHQIVPQPVEPEQLTDAIAQALTRRHEIAAAAPSGPKGRVVSLIGSGGGAGATSLAVQAACSLSRRNDAPTTCLIDLDIQFGTAALLLDAEQRSSIFDLVQELERLDGALLRGAMTAAARGKFDLLAAPANFHPIEDIEPEAIAAVIEVASSEYQLTLLDLPLLWSHWTHAALRSSHAIVLVVQPTVPSVRQGRRQLDMLRQEELDDIPLTIVLNRAETGLLRADAVARKEAETALGRKIDHVVPESPALKAAAQSGLPLGEVRGGRPLEKKIAAMFEGLLPAPQPPATEAPARRAFRLPFGRAGLLPALALGR